MKRLFTALSIIFTLFLVSPNYSNAQVVKTDKLDLIIPNAITSSVSIFGVGEKGYASCSGVVIKNTPTESIVLTAKHCITSEIEIFVEHLKAYSVGISITKDLAYIKLDKFISFKTPVKLSNYIPHAKDKITGIGYPKGELYITKGIIFLETLEHQMAKMEIKLGCSGGGVFNEDGELIGIMLGHVPYFNVSMLTKLQDLHKFINVNKLLE